MPEIPLEAFNLCVFTRSPRLELVYMSLSLFFGAFLPHVLRNSSLKEVFVLRRHDIFCDRFCRFQKQTLAANVPTQHPANGPGGFYRVLLGDIQLTSGVFGYAVDDEGKVRLLLAIRAVT